jgi:DNA primase
LLYGNIETEFENVFYVIDENGKEIEEIKNDKQKVYEKIYLSLQEDEVEFANPIFNSIYNDLMIQYQRNDLFDKNQYVNNLSSDFAPLVTDILMNDEKYQLHGWLEKKQVFVKEKEDSEILARLITENIAAFREYLISKLSKGLGEKIKNEEIEDTTDIMTQINDYNKLKVIISRKIGRMRSNYN